MAGRSNTRPEDQTGAVSQSLPANFYSSIHQPATPHIRPTPGDEKEIPDLEMPEPSPGGVGIMEKIAAQGGSFSLKDNGGFMPAQRGTMSVPVRSSEFKGLRRDNEDMEELRNSMKILSIIDETTEVGKEETENQGDDYGDDGDGDGDGDFFEMEMDE